MGHQQGGRGWGYHIVTIENKDSNGNTFCLDVGTDKPNADETKVVLKKPDGSERQKWLLWVDFAAESILHQLAPRVDGSLVMSAQGNFGGPWDHVVLSTSLSESVAGHGGYPVRDRGRDRPLAAGPKVIAHLATTGDRYMRAARVASRR